ncbi:MAG: heavy metal translocating P-type ATPase metal-binding domain-containing protein [Rhodospirillales bacterium]
MSAPPVSAPPVGAPYVRSDDAACAATDACRHCGETLAAGAASGFCCRGCEAAFAVIQGLGLGAFYERRGTTDDGRRLRPDDRGPVDLAGRVRSVDGIGHLDLLVDGLHCAACVWLIESVLARAPDVVTARVQLAGGRLSLAWKGPPERANALVGAVAGLGFRLVPFDPSCLRSTADRADTELLRALGVTAFASMNVMMLSVGVWMGWEMGPATRDLLHWMSALVAMPAIAWAGLPFYRPAFAALRRGRVNMDVPISLGILLTTAMSLSETIRSGPFAYFDGAVTLLFFLLLGRYLDRRARGRARSTAAQLLALRATAATRIDADGVARPVAPEALAVGDEVLVASGERVPADGTVRHGRSDLDAALVTGESAPQAVEPGARVFAGMINLSAPLRVGVTATGDGTLLAEIGRLMDAAERGRAGFTALADRVAGLYAPVVHTVAAATFLGWWLGMGVGWQEALLYAVAALIITCPCGLALAVPAVQVVATGRLLRRGILAKSPTALERLALVDTVVFDKTGTLTLGRPVLVPDPTRDPADLAAAAGLARASRHPLARALARACPAAPVRDDVTEMPGLGLAAGDARLGSAVFCGVVDATEGSSPHLWFVRRDRAAVRFVFEDPLRPDAAEVVAALRDRGLDVRLLSGDRARVVAAAAAAAGIPRWIAETSPVGTVAALDALRAEGRRVLMVGDGLNDAPALAAASVSMSPAEAADISQTAADVVFRGERLAAVADVLGTARLADRVVRQNLAFALVYNVVAVPMAILGLVTPAIAAAVMSTSSIAVVLNALRTGRSLKGASIWTS